MKNPDAPATAVSVVVMGVSGYGKSTVGRALAAALGVPIIEADDLHPPRNVALMASGTQLTDDDRRGWLHAVAAALSRAADTGAVAACSALKRSCRDMLRGRVPGLRFVHLVGERAALEVCDTRRRSGHYMPASLLHSQLDILQPPTPDEAAITLDLDAKHDEVVQAVRQQLEASAAVQSELGPPSIAPYTASKGAAKMLTKGRAIDLGSYRITVNGLGQGYFKTDLTAPLVAATTFSAWLINRPPSRRWGEVEDLAAAAIFLASDAARSVNGHILSVEGGVTATL